MRRDLNNRVSQTTPSAAQATKPINSQRAQSLRQSTSVVILDPAHGGTNLGARGASGIRESDLNLYFAAQVKIALEQNGFTVIQTRQGNENPSFDDRSAMANAHPNRPGPTIEMLGRTALPGPETAPLCGFFLGVLGEGFRGMSLRCREQVTHLFFLRLQVVLEG